MRSILQQQSRFALTTCLLLLLVAAGCKEPLDCGNGVEANGVCVCDPGYVGTQCDSIACDPLCQNGTCDNGICRCENGWAGDDCGNWVGEISPTYVGDYSLDETCSCGGQRTYNVSIRLNIDQEDAIEIDSLHGGGNPCDQGAGSVFTWVTQDSFSFVTVLGAGLVRGSGTRNTQGDQIDITYVAEYPAQTPDTCTAVLTK